MALAGKIGVAAAARELELHESQIYGWRSKAAAPRNKSELEQQQATEIARLKRQLADQDEELAILKKLQHVSLKNYEDTASAKYGFMQNHRDPFTVSAMIRVLDVSRSGFYAWQRRQAVGNGREVANQVMDAQVLEAFEARKGRSGSPGLVLDLADAGCVRNRKTIAKSMKRQGLRAKAARKFKVTTDSDHDKAVASNLLNQDFSAVAPYQKIVATQASTGLQVERRG